MLAEIEARAIRQADIEQHAVGLLFREGRHSLPAGQGVADLETLGFEGIDQGIRDRGFIFDQQDGAHTGR